MQSGRLHAKITLHRRVNGIAQIQRDFDLLGAGQIRAKVRINGAPDRSRPDGVEFLAALGEGEFDLTGGL